MASLKSLTAAILCGGLGLRLRRAVPDRPKCLAPIRSKPFLELQILWLRSQGVRHVVLCLGFGSEQVLSFLRQTQHQGVETESVIEDGLLGTAGALKNAEGKIIGSPFLAMNGDSMLDVSLEKMVDFHTLKKAVATIAVVDAPRTGRYGRIVTDGADEITGFLEKRGGDDETAETSASQTRGFINGGLYVFNREILDMIPPQPHQGVSLEKDIFPRLAGRGLFGFETHGYFLDIGVPEDYVRAQIELAQRFPTC